MLSVSRRSSTQNVSASLLQEQLPFSVGHFVTVLAEQTLPPTSPGSVCVATSLPASPLAESGEHGVSRGAPCCPVACTNTTRSRGSSVCSSAKQKHEEAAAWILLSFPWKALLLTATICQGQLPPGDGQQNTFCAGKHQTPTPTPVPAWQLLCHVGGRVLCTVGGDSQASPAFYLCALQHALCLLQAWALVAASASVLALALWPLLVSLLLSAFEAPGSKAGQEGGQEHHKRRATEMLRKVPEGAHAALPRSALPLGSSSQAAPGGSSQCLGAFGPCQAPSQNGPGSSGTPGLPPAMPSSCCMGLPRVTHEGLCLLPCKGRHGQPHAAPLLPTAGQLPRPPPAVAWAAPRQVLPHCTAIPPTNTQQGPEQRQPLLPPKSKAPWSGQPASLTGQEDKEPTGEPCPRGSF